MGSLRHAAIGVRGSLAATGQRRLNFTGLARRVYPADSQRATWAAIAQASRPSNGPTWLGEPVSSTCAPVAAAMARVIGGGTSSSWAETTNRVRTLGDGRSTPAWASRSTAPD